MSAERPDSGETKPPTASAPRSSKKHIRPTTPHLPGFRTLQRCCCARARATARLARASSPLRLARGFSGRGQGWRPVTNGRRHAGGDSMCLFGGTRPPPPAAGAVPLARRRQQVSRLSAAAAEGHANIVLPLSWPLWQPSSQKAAGGHPRSLLAPRAACGSAYNAA